jgi:hypothetical protein
MLFAALASPRRYARLSAKGFLPVALSTDSVVVEVPDVSLLPERLRPADAQCLRGERLPGSQRGVAENLLATGETGNLSRLPDGQFTRPAGCVARQRPGTSRGFAFCEVLKIKSGPHRFYQGFSRTTSSPLPQRKHNPMIFMNASNVPTRRGPVDMSLAFDTSGHAAVEVGTSTQNSKMMLHFGRNGQSALG